MPLKPYDEFAQEPLAFPIREKTYTPPPLGAKTGVMLVRALAGDPDVATKDAKSLWQQVLGPVYDQMIEDDVPMDALARAAFAALVDFQNGRDAAERVWESGIDPEAMAAMTAALRSQIQHSTRPAAAPTTRSRASGTGTKPTAKTATPRKPATRSRGRGSSPSGS